MGTCDMRENEFVDLMFTAIINTRSIARCSTVQRHD
jgi:hypothetical protein